MTNIIESIGSWGVRSSKTTHGQGQARFEKPRPGDVVDFGDNVGTYPFTYGQFGRISEIGSANGWGGGWCEDGKAVVCCEPGSAFLNEDGSVSISGGPFQSIDPADLEPMYTTHQQRFWNWGDNGPGAGHGVDYFLHRPVFRLKLQPKSAKG